MEIGAMDEGEFNTGEKGEEKAGEKADREEKNGFNKNTAIKPREKDKNAIKKILVFMKNAFSHTFTYN